VRGTDPGIGKGYADIKPTDCVDEDRLVGKRAGLWNAGFTNQFTRQIVLGKYSSAIHGPGSRYNGRKTAGISSGAGRRELSGLSRWNGKCDGSAVPGRSTVLVDESNRAKRGTRCREVRIFFLKCYRTASSAGCSRVGQEDGRLPDGSTQNAVGHV